MPDQVKNPVPAMRCKLILQSITDSTYVQDGYRKNVRFGAVWEGSTEAQQQSENAIFGSMTPCAEFNASICNPAVIEALVPGRAYYVTFTEVPPAASGE